MSFEILRCHHAGSGEQTGKPAGEAEVHDEESHVGTEHGNPAGKPVRVVKSPLSSGGVCERHRYWPQTYRAAGIYF